jgi:flagellin
MTVINTNIKSLVAQDANRAIGLSQATSMQRLSTGLRVNSAKDDAAGLAIGTRMEAQTRGLSMAIRNANDGISLMQTAEGSLQEVTNSLQRMRELSVQASNGINNAADRTALDKEVQQLKQEIDRIATKTQFNNINILDGSYKDKHIQIGDKANQVMNVSIASAKTKDLGLGNGGSSNVYIGTRLQDGDQGGSRTDDIAAGLADGTDRLVINGKAINFIKDETSGAASDTASTDINDVVVAINNSDAGVKASAFNDVVAKVAGNGVADKDSIVITVTAVDTGKDIEYKFGETKSMQDLVDKINAVGSEGSVKAKITDDGKLELYNNTGAKIKVEDGSATADYAGATGFATDATTFHGMLRLESTTDAPLTIGTNWRETSGSRADEATILKTLGLNAIDMLSDGVQKTTGPVLIGAEVTDANIKTEWLKGEIKINGVDIWRSGYETDGTSYADQGIVGSAGVSQEDFAWTQKINLINSFSADTGVVASKYALEDGTFSFQLQSSTGSPVSIQLGDLKEATLANSAADVGYTGFDVFGFEEMNVGAADFDTNAPTYGAVGGGGSALSGLNILTEKNALGAIQILDNALEQVSDMRADLGAKQNRLNSTVNNLTNVVTNTEASKSRIMDTDYGKETTNLARAQIISQAATAMLAQANQSAQSVLSLLK